MRKQPNNLLGWLLGTGVALLLCVISVAVSSYHGEQGRETVLLFDSLPYLPIFVFAVTLLTASKLRRPGDRIEGDRVLRHDGIARLTHWTTAFGCLLLLATGIALGFLFIPRFVVDATATAIMFNLHFVGVLFFVFGCGLWATNQLVEPRRLGTHLPDESVWVELKKSVLHYTHMLGMTKIHVEAPKYHHSGRLAGLVIIASSSVVILSGFGKLLARSADLNPGIAELINLSHGWAALALLLLIPVHAFLGGIAPWAWNTLTAMFTGYVSRDYAQKEHAIWFRELEEKQRHQESQQ
ncbi:hypothetical protein Ssed_2570 [Shewanella sediminis HAW-EB3]|uniref:Cytochrome b561 bacterial/Ni-hydrogenase domain-containing protein n=1 Tax=Shewanella sediminis (strain HAW-EB3) TaxID=425104 RepID=A8FWF4_SHESH|nr:cytochrome b/b6 domain-containing protein [Shewanella sediminis]ABV37177.1 hypothetical protein Ssed_2570 [Shewanella sediminis HAW-EB3]